LLDWTATYAPLRPPVVEMWRTTLLRIPTVFGRLAYIAALLDESTGRYNHPSLSFALNPEDVDRTLRRYHHQVFTEWLGFSLSEQRMDLCEFFDEQGAEPESLRYQELVPPRARDVERQLYITDLETLLELMRFDALAASPFPEA
jgi:hypothetical protein